MGLSPASRWSAHKYDLTDEGLSLTPVLQALYGCVARPARTGVDVTPLLG